jgi:hypothetical protein
MYSALAGTFIILSIGILMAHAAACQQQSDAERMRIASDHDMIEWRALYDQAWRAGFRFDIGNRHHVTVTGVEARRRHLEHHGVPRPLISQRDAECNRSSK